MTVVRRLEAPATVWCGDGWKPPLRCGAAAAGSPRYGVVRRRLEAPATVRC
ncbi:MAG: hypothetical protein RIK87_05080 [Fuerstiella sp.]